jgi:hypothetical protein
MRFIDPLSPVRAEAEATEGTEAAAREHATELGALLVVEGLVDLAERFLGAFAETRELGVVALERGVERMGIERRAGHRRARGFTGLADLALERVRFVEELGERRSNGLLLTRAGVEVGEEAVEHGEGAAAPSTVVTVVMAVVPVVAAATGEAGVATATEDGDEADQGRDTDHESEHGGTS